MAVKWVHLHPKSCTKPKIINKVGRRWQISNPPKIPIAPHNLGWRRDQLLFQGWLEVFKSQRGHPFLMIPNRNAPGPFYVTPIDVIHIHRQRRRRNWPRGQPSHRHKCPIGSRIEGNGTGLRDAGENFGNWIKNWGGLKINYFRNFLNGIRLRGKTEKGRIYWFLIVNKIVMNNDDMALVSKIA